MELILLPNIVDSSSEFLDLPYNEFSSGIWKLFDQSSARVAPLILERSGRPDGPSAGGPRAATVPCLSLLPKRICSSCEAKQYRQQRQPLHELLLILQTAVGSEPSSICWGVICASQHMRLIAPRLRHPHLRRHLNFFEDLEDHRRYRLARNVEFIGQSLESYWMASASRRASKIRRFLPADRAHPGACRECLEAVPCFLRPASRNLAAAASLGKQILPFALTSVPARGNRSRGTPPHPLVHVGDDLRYAKLAGNLPNLIGVQIVLVECRNFALRTAQTEERLLLARRRSQLHE